MRNSIPHHFATILLAAGGSRRMEGAHKLLEPVGGESLIVHAARAALDASLGPVVAVVGHRGEEIEAVLPPGVRALRNPSWNDGLSSSISAGLSALPEVTSAVLVALGDMPFISASHHRRVAAAWHPGTIVVPAHEGRPGHPVALAADFFPELLALEGDRGARSVVLSHPKAVTTLPIDDPAIVTDVDDLDSLSRVRAEAGARFSGAAGTDPFNGAPR